MASYEQLQAWFSVHRLASFEEAAGGSLELAVRLYEWNAEVSAAFLEVMHHTEVLLRNRIHDVMTAAFPDDPAPWFRQEGIFAGAKGPKLVGEAIARVEASGMEATVGRMVASLPFGFWNGLFGRAYSQLWAQVLHRCFAPHGPGKRERVVEVTERIKLFRNRLAHHERVVNEDLRSRHDDLLKLAMWIDPAARTWILSTSNVPAVLLERPA